MSRSPHGVLAQVRVIAGHCTYAERANFGKQTRHAMGRSVFALLLGLPLFATAQSQLAVDTNGIQNNIIYTGTVASNGDRVLALRNADGVLLWRSQMDGTPVWARRITDGAGDAQPVLRADQQGGVVMLRHVGTEAIVNFPFEGFVDTLRMHYVLTRVDQNGDLDWQRLVDIEYDFDQGVMLGWEEADIAVTGDAIYMGLRHVLSWEHLAFLKFDLLGQLTWYRNFGWNQFLGNWNMFNLVADNGGGLYVHGQSTALNQVYVARVQADGTLSWLKHYQYSTSFTSWLQDGAAMATADGSLLAVREIDIPGHDYLATLQVDQQGVVTDAHFYAHPAIAQSNPFGIGAMGDGTTMLAIDSLVVQVDGNGEVLQAATFNSHVSGVQRNTFKPLGMNARPEGAVFSGVLDQVHVDLGVTHHWPAVRTIDPEQPGCYAEQVDVSHVNVPNELYTVTDHGGFTERSLDVQVLVGPGTSTPAANLGVQDLCVLMIPASIGTVAGPGSADLLNSVARQGEPFRFTTSQPRRVTVLDAAGRSVQKDLLLTDGVHTMGWAPGLYVLRITGPDGSALRAHRVVVTP